MEGLHVLEGVSSPRLVLWPGRLGRGRRLNLRGIRLARSVLPRTATSSWSRAMRTRWPRCWGAPSPAGLRSVGNRAARPAACEPWRLALGGRAQHAVGPGGGFLPARRSARRGWGAGQARAAVPLYCAPGGVDPAALAHCLGAGALPAQDPVPRRYHRRAARAGRLHRPALGPGAQDSCPERSSRGSALENSQCLLVADPCP